MNNLDQEILDLINTEFKTRYENGEKGALVTALNLCTCLEDNPMPLWVAESVSEALQNWERFEAETLDEAFNVEKPKHFRMDTVKKRIRLKGQIQALVFKAKRNGESINEELFIEIAKQVGSNKTNVQDIYYGKIIIPDII